VFVNHKLDPPNPRSPTTMLSACQLRQLRKAFPASTTRYDVTGMNEIIPVYKTLEAFALFHADLASARLNQFALVLSKARNGSAKSDWTE